MVPQAGAHAVVVPAVTSCQLTPWALTSLVTTALSTMLVSDPAVAVAIGIGDVDRNGAGPDRCKRYGRRGGRGRDSRGGDHDHRICRHSGRRGVGQRGVGAGEGAGADHSPGDARARLVIGDDGVQRDGLVGRDICPAADGHRSDVAGDGRRSRQREWR